MHDSVEHVGSILEVKKGNDSWSSRQPWAYVSFMLVCAKSLSSVLGQ